MKITEKYSKIRWIENTGMVHHTTRFYPITISKNQPNPKHHVHISQKRIGTEDFMMYKTFQEYFFTGFQGFQAEKISPDRSFVLLEKRYESNGQYLMTR